MRTPPPTPTNDRGFTLIELLVVVTIIGILVAIILPVFGTMTDRSRKTQAVSDERSLMTAVFAYMGDNNNQFPANSDQLNGAPSGYDTVYGDPGNARNPGYWLMDILRGVDTDGDNYNANDALNHSKTVYFDEPYAKNPKEPRSGILQQNYNDGSYTIKKGSFVDPWGSEYLVWLDVCRDNNLNDGMIWFYPAFPKDTDLSKPKYGPFGSVQIGSLGPDGNFGKNGTVDGSDDILLVQ